MWAGMGCLVTGGSFIESQQDPSVSMPTTTQARGQYTLSQAASLQNQMFQGAYWPSVADPMFANVQVNMHMNQHSPNGNIRTMPPQFNPTDGTAWENNSSSPNGGIGRWPNRKFWLYNYLGQGGTVIDIQQNITIGTNDVTIDGWLFLTNALAVVVVYDMRSGAGDTNHVLIRVNNGKLSLFRNGVAVVEDTVAMSTNTWHHWAWDRDTVAGNSYIYLDGVSKGTPAVDATNYGIASTTRVGQSFAGANAFAGNLEEFRITIGSGAAGSRYPGGTSFAVPVAPFPDY